MFYAFLRFLFLICLFADAAFASISMQCVARVHQPFLSLTGVWTAKIEHDLADEWMRVRYYKDAERKILLQDHVYWIDTKASYVAGQCGVEDRTANLVSRYGSCRNETARHALDLLTNKTITVPQIYSVRMNPDSPFIGWAKGSDYMIVIKPDPQDPDHPRKRHILQCTVITVN